jgi:hypothetical protein
MRGAGGFVIGQLRGTNARDRQPARRERSARTSPQCSNVKTQRVEQVWRRLEIDGPGDGCIGNARRNRVVRIEQRDNVPAAGGGGEIDGALAVAGRHIAAGAGRQQQANGRLAGLARLAGDDQRRSSHRIERIERRIACRDQFDDAVGAGTCRFHQGGGAARIRDTELRTGIDQGFRGRGVAVQRGHHQGGATERIVRVDLGLAFEQQLDPGGIVVAVGRAEQGRLRPLAFGFAPRSSRKRASTQLPAAHAVASDSSHRD